MKSFNIHSPHIQSVTSIPDVFFDTYMLRANGEFLKVYLYLYRWCKVSGADFSLSSIADRLSMTESDVWRALRYWQSEGLIRISTDATGQPTELEMVEIPANSVPDNMRVSGNARSDTNVNTGNNNLNITKPMNSANSMSNMNTISSTQNINPTGSINPSIGMQNSMVSSVNDYVKPSYTMQQIQEFNEQTKDEQIFLVIEQYIGKPLSQNDMNTIIFFYERLGFSPSLIEYLVEYCVGNEHRSLRYMEKVAISWAQAGIDTVEKAKRHTEGYSRIYYDVLKAFGIHNRGPAAAEADYIKKWAETYGFSQSIILEACNRTMSKIHQPSFNYADKILGGWHEAKVHHIEDIQALDTQFEQKRQAATKNTAQRKPATQTVAGQTTKPSSSNRFHNFNQRTYNYSDLEQKLAKKRQTIPKP